MDFQNVGGSRNQNLEMQIARLEMILDISRSLNSTLDLDALLQSIMEVATQLTNAEAASILLVEKKSGELYFEAATANQAAMERIQVPMEGSIAGWIVQNGEALVIDNAQQDYRHFAGVDQQTNFVTQNILGVPLTAKQKTIGVLEVVNKHGKSGFSRDDINILNILADQAAVAIENARLFHQSDELANVVHELRSPMVSIIGYSELMLMQPNMSPEQLRTVLESINKEANRLSQMINDFLDLTRLETGRTRMASDPVDLSRLVQEVVDQLYPQAVKNEVKVSLQVGTDIPELKGDNNRLKQVILNLVDNAIKYNWQDGEVKVELSCNEVRVQLSVYNTGQGIGRDDLELVFDKFYRIQVEENEVRGTGLGLPIAKQIIEAHGGDIWVESEVGVSSTFTFSLPLQPIT